MLKSKIEENITVVIKTFLRPKTCEHTVSLWRSIYGSELQIIVVDDGNINPTFNKELDINYYKLPFDTGASSGRNFGIRQVATDFLFISDDDNSPPKKENLQKCLETLRQTNIDILGCNAFNLTITNKNAIIQKQKIPANEYALCDFTTQHFLAKTKRILLWDESIKIDGEHFDYFMRCKRENIIVAGTPLLNFRKTIKDNKDTIAIYRKYRYRKQFKTDAKQKWDINNIKWTY